MMVTGYSPREIAFCQCVAVNVSFSSVSWAGFCTTEESLSNWAT